MVAYEYDPTLETVNKADCPGIELEGRGNTGHCMYVSDVEIDSRTSEFICAWNACPLVGASALRSALEGDE